MPKSVFAFLALVAILSWFSVNANGQRVAEKNSPPVQKWEYIIVSKGLGEFQSTDVPSWLSEHGNAGWEICDVLQHSQSRQFVFKRPK